MAEESYQVREDGSNQPGAVVEAVGDANGPGKAHVILTLGHHRIRAVLQEPPAQRHHVLQQPLVPAVLANGVDATEAEYVG